MKGKWDEKIEFACSPRSTGSDALNFSLQLHNDKKSLKVIVKGIRFFLHETKLYIHSIRIVNYSKYSNGSLRLKILMMKKNMQIIFKFFENNQVAIRFPRFRVIVRNRIIF